MNISLYTPRLLSNCQGSAQSSHLDRALRSRRKMSPAHQIWVPSPRTKEVGGWLLGQWGGAGGLPTWECHIPLPRLKIIMVNIYQMLIAGQEKSTPLRIVLMFPKTWRMISNCLFIHLFIYYFDKHLLSIYYGPGTELWIYQQTKYMKITVKLNFWWDTHFLKTAMICIRRKHSAFVMTLTLLPSSEALCLKVGLKLID